MTSNPCTSSLSPFSNDPDSCAPHQHVLSGKGDTDAGLLKAVEVVGLTSGELEGEVHHIGWSRLDNQYGRLEEGPGCGPGPEANSGPLDRGRKESAYKCARTERGSVCIEDFCQGPAWDSCAFENGLSNFSILHSEIGRYQIRLHKKYGSLPWIGEFHFPRNTCRDL